jgi:hypothetical protein
MRLNFLLNLLLYKNMPEGIKNISHRAYGVSLGSKVRVNVSVGVKLGTGIGVLVRVLVGSDVAEGKGDGEGVLVGGRA